MDSEAFQLAARLAANVEAVCRHYLSQGRRSGRYWLVGDVNNTPGRSLFVRLAGPAHGPGAAGKWTDAATGEHGDLLDLIRLNRGHTSLRETLAEAREFLREPTHLTAPFRQHMPRNGVEVARRLFAASKPITGTLAETYLRSRGITTPLRFPTLRFHPACYYRDRDGAQLVRWPALIAAVTDLSGTITGVHRIWLARDGRDKAPVADPRRSRGNLLGQGVRFGAVSDVLAATEGIETALALKSLLPGLPIVAALSAGNLAALALPSNLRRLYIAADNDKAGLRALARLRERAADARIDAHDLLPCYEDWNEELLEAGYVDAFRTAVSQLRSEEIVPFRLFERCLSNNECSPREKAAQRLDIPSVV